MAEDRDRESQTEEPTERRLTDAIDKGNIPHSREAVTFGALTGLFVCLKLLVSWSALRLMRSMAELLAGAGGLRLEQQGDLTRLLARISFEVAAAVLPLLGVMAAFTVLAALAQSMPQANVERIAPKFSRLSPQAGFRKIFSIAALIEFAKALAKVAVVAAITGTIIRKRLGDTMNVIAMDPRAIPALVLDIVTVIVASLALVSLVLAGADIVWARFKWRRDLRMTRQEVKEEHKQAEGDPMVKLRIRNVARQRISRRMMGRLPQATLVVANPTHYAIAMRYVRNEGGAPKVIAKGLDHLALLIRERAEALEIPVVEDRPLARALHEVAEIDQEIPPEFYKAVAEIIHFLQTHRLYTAPAVRDTRQPGASLHA